MFRSISAENADPKELVYDGADPGIDGVMIFIDDHYVSSEEEVAEAFKGRKRDSEVTVVFTQVESSESWSKAEINTFESGVSDFISEDSSYPHSDYMANAKAVFNAVIG